MSRPGLMRIIALSLPTPYPVGPVNAYLLPGPPVTLVDCGPKTDEARAALEAGLGGAGVTFGQIERLIITHGHLDHFGLAATVAAGGAEVYAHKADLPKLRGERWFVEPLRTLIAEAGFEPGLADTLLEAFRRSRKQFDDITPAHFLADGDRIELADSALEVLHTPGHAQGHICLWDGQALIAGDLLLEEISPNPIIEFNGDGRRLPTLPAYLRSLHRVAALAPVIAYPGHGDPLTDPGGRIREILRHHDERKEHLARMLDGRTWTLRELAAAWYPDVDLFNLFLALSEIVGHLDLLAEEGRVTAERRDGIVRYALARPPRA
ncbi:MAG TPA: MBL fold metallo-hydrolase [bacterium]|nr:MBL fold metallo-hydrolase [bacterium]